MMTFVERADRSFLVATPGQHAMHHMTHTPFLMARAGSPIAKAFDMKPAAGVVPAAFDTSLDRHAVRASSCIATSTTPHSTSCPASSDAVTNHADEMALMNRIAPGQARPRQRREVGVVDGVAARRQDRKLRGPPGRAQGVDVRQLPAAADRRRQLPAATAAATTIRLTSAAEAATFTRRPARRAELWVISAAAAWRIGRRTRRGSNTREVLFEYLVDAHAGRRDLCRSDRASRAGDRAAVRQRHERQQRHHRRRSDGAAAGRSSAASRAMLLGTSDAK